jgi:hypothetical protein
MFLSVKIPRKFDAAGRVATRCGADVVERVLGIDHREGLVLLPEVADRVRRHQAVAALDRCIGPAIVADVCVLGHACVSADRRRRHHARRHDDNGDADNGG